MTRRACCAIRGAPKPYRHFEVADRDLLGENLQREANLAGPGVAEILKPAVAPRMVTSTDV